MVELIPGGFGAVAFILGRYSMGGGRLQRMIGNWLWISGAFITVTATFHIWSQLGITAAREPLFLLVWMGLPVLWNYRGVGMAVPMREIPVAALWALIAVMLCDISFSKFECLLPAVSFLSITIAPEHVGAASPSMTGYILPSLCFAVALIAALESEPALHSTNWPWFFTLAFTGFFLAFLGALGDHIPSNMSSMAPLLLASFAMVVVWLWFKVSTKRIWWRAFFTPVLFLAMVGVSLGILLGFS